MSAPPRIGEAPRGTHEWTLDAWLVRAVRAIPPSIDAGQAAAMVGATPRHVRAIRESAPR